MEYDAWKLSHPASRKDEIIPRDARHRVYLIVRPRPFLRRRTDGFSPPRDEMRSQARRGDRIDPSCFRFLHASSNRAADSHSAGDTRGTPRRPLNGQPARMEGRANAAKTLRSFLHTREFPQLDSFLALAHSTFLADRRRPRPARDKRPVDETITRKLLGDRVRQSSVYRA